MNRLYPTNLYNLFGCWGVPDEDVEMQTTLNEEIFEETYDTRNARAAHSAESLVARANANLYQMQRQGLEERITAEQQAEVRVLSEKAAGDLTKFFEFRRNCKEQISGEKGDKTAREMDDSFRIHYVTGAPALLEAADASVNLFMQKCQEFNVDPDRFAGIMDRLAINDYLKNKAKYASSDLS